MLGVAVVLLEAKEKILTWPLTIIKAALGLLVYYERGLYAKCFLNIIYFSLSLYGWYWWLYGNKRKTPLKVSTTSKRTLWVLLLVGVLFTFVLRSILDRFTHADLAYRDSLHTALCLIALYMTARKKLESWIVWVIADSLYTVVCYHKELYWFGGLHAFYIILGIYGYYTWRQAYRHTQMVLTSAW